MRVFLDTNVYIGANYIVNKGKFSIIQYWIEKLDLKLLCNTIVKNEVHQHIQDDVLDKIENLNRIIRKDLRFLDAIDNNIMEINCNDIRDKIIGTFDSFITENSKMLEIGNIDGEKLAYDYFNFIPPFEERKPFEFKDALSIKSIIDYTEANPEITAIVSNDKGFIKAFENNPSFITFKYLSNFISYYQKNCTMDYVLEVIDTAVNSNEIDEVIDYYFYVYVTIDREGYDECDCEIIQIHNLSHDIVYIESTPESKTESYKNITVHLNLKCLLDVKLKYLDLDNSFYDNEEGIYTIKEYKEGSEYHDIDMDISLQFIMDNEGGILTYSDCFVGDDSPKTLDLNDTTEIDIEGIFNEIFTK